MNWLKYTCVSITLLLSSSAFAASIAGTWQQFDDDSHELRSLIQITEQGGVFSGQILKIFPHADEPQNPLCSACKGDKLNAPFIGLTIIENVRADGTAFGGGSILDPEDGTQYRVKLTLSADGKSLNVKGFVGIELLGRSQIWQRVK